MFRNFLQTGFSRDVSLSETEASMQIDQHVIEYDNRHNRHPRRNIQIFIVILSHSKTLLLPS